MNISPCTRHFKTSPCVLGNWDILLSRLNNELMKKKNIIAAALDGVHDYTFIHLSKQELQLAQSNRRSSVSFTDRLLPSHLPCSFALYKSQQVNNHNNSNLLCLRQSAGASKTSSSSHCALWISGIK